MSRRVMSTDANLLGFLAFIHRGSLRGDLVLTTYHDSTTYVLWIAFLFVLRRLRSQISHRSDNLERQFN